MENTKQQGKDTLSTPYKSILKESICAFKLKDIKIYKESKNEFFKNRYADLATILDAIEVESAKCGLVITSQLITGDSIVLTTTLSHKDSEEIIQSSFPVFGAKPQEIGSSISYARRYNIQSLLNLAAEDDDGNAANDAPKVRASFNNATARKAYCEGVIKAIEGSETVKELNGHIAEQKDKFKAMRESGDEHDLLGVEELNKRYQAKLALLKDAEFLEKQQAEFEQRK